MGQIVKRKKKGRPSKADLARRNAAAEPPAAVAPDREIRRSHRRRSVRYTFDYDDYIDEDDEDDEDERRREKKLKLLLKLHGKEDDAESMPSQTRRVAHAPAASASSSDCGNGKKPLKKRKIDGDDETLAGDADEHDDEHDNDIDEDDDDDDDDEARGRKAEPKGVDSVPGTPSDPPSRFPLPDKKSLELLLDKLQKKDIYGVYAEPVDPEELPDYHDVISHPMDFATVRKKLANGTYSTMEQFESDVYLICSNAMQYNAPDTIYYKQARSIQELAKKKFERLRINIEPSQKELKSEEKTRLNSFAKKQAKNLMSQTMQEPVGSDFSTGATLATAGDLQNSSNAAQPGACERPSGVDGHVEGNSSLIDNNLDKTEELLSGKGLVSRFGRKPTTCDENRRATYNISIHPAVVSESTFTTFEGEMKLLVPVGLHADHSYARSLARFAATLGPVAWNVASRRIEQALPKGFKFGHGWVGEYEPLPTPVLILESHQLKEPAFLTNFQHTADTRNDARTSNTLVSGHTLKGKSSSFGSAGTKPTTTSSTRVSLPALEEPVAGASLGASFFCPPGMKSTTVNSEQQRSQLKDLSDTEKKAVKQVGVNCPPSVDQRAVDFIAEKQILDGSEMPASRSIEMVARNRNLLQSVSFKQLNNNGAVAGGMPNGKVVTDNLDSNRVASSSAEGFPNQLARAATYIPQGQEQGLSDPVQLMRMITEKAQNQQKSSNHSLVDTHPVIPPVPSSRRDDSSNATMAAARTWMSIGAAGFKPAAENTSTHRNQISAESLYNPARDLQPQDSLIRGEFPVSGMHFRPENNGFPLHAFVPQHIRMENTAQFQHQPMAFPQQVTADLSRFQVQSRWRGLGPQMHPRQKQESLPPDLNIGFHSSGSPVRQSSGVLVDSQQPDLALQL